MNCEELDPNNVQHDPSESKSELATHQNYTVVTILFLGAPIIIEHGNFHWGDDPILKNINLRFAKNCLSAVVGKFNFIWGEGGICI